ncbi:MAG: hypothetical protein EZS28_014475 [Streblomastix strix]|uniref:Uncharacterized protein n=1 Tax=Streblomastix strix TaxID=222440 RepID=A0A5J4W5H2_9EUKA|nr:MAG: hypothetical protein EZS28_014475 [Streblomastix strix]
MCVQNQKQTLDFAKKQLENITAKITEYETLHKLDGSFIKECALTLARYSEFLMNSHIFMFFAKPCQAKDLLQLQQKQLLDNEQQLNTFLEQSVESLDSNQIIHVIPLYQRQLDNALKQFSDVGAENIQLI